MSMFNLSGRIVNTYATKGYINRETGEQTPAKYKVQVMGEMPVDGGDSRYEMITLSVPNGLNFGQFLNKVVSIPLGFFVPAGQRDIVYFIPKGASVTVIPETKAA